MPPTLSAREADALANMMGADSRRIDGLAQDVGEVKGAVHGLRSDMGHVSKGVDELRGAMTILSRHAVLMETVLTDISALRAGSVRSEQETRENFLKVDARFKLIEQDLPVMRLTRDWTLRGVLLVVFAVVAAVVALVVKNGGVA